MNFKFERSQETDRRTEQSSPRSKPHRWAFVVALAIGFLSAVGCPSSGLPESGLPSSSLASVTVADTGDTGDRGNDVTKSGSIDGLGEELPRLIRRIDRALQDNLDNRRLDVTMHGGWQVMHGVLAYGRDFQVGTNGRMNGPKAGAREVEAVQYLLEGQRLGGFDPRPGDAFEIESDGQTVVRKGLRFELEPTTKVGQGHRDQWFAILAQCGLSPETEFVASGQTFEMMDLVRQSEYDVPLNLEEEFSWTLIGLVQYRGTDHVWVARDGREYSIELLVEVESNQSLTSSVCGGTHRLNGIAMSLNRRRFEGRPIAGVWTVAESRVKEAIEMARQTQNPDGSYSLAYLHRAGWARDLSEQLGTTGHVLEFLALAADDATLQSTWVMRSAGRICDLLQQCKSVDLECGVLYHALHGLQEYRSRIEKLP